MKIALDMRTLNIVTGGIERYTIRVYQELLKKNQDLFYPFPFNMNTSLDFNNKLKFTFEMSTSDWELSRKTELLLAELNHIDLLFSPYVPISSIGNYKKVLTIHDLIPITSPELVHSSNSFDFLNNNIRRSAETCDVIITDSEFSKREIIKCYGVPEEKVKVIYLGHDISNPNEINFKEYLINLGLEDVPYILAVGAMEKRKNLTKVLEVFERLKTYETYSKYKLVLTGALRGDNSEFINAYEHHPNRDDIIVTGFVEDEVLIVLYQNTQVFLFLSLCEGFGLPILEAMAMGAPVITSNKSSLPEVGGDAAAYCDPTDIHSIEAALLNVLEDEELRKEMVKKGFERSTQFTWEKTAGQLLKVFEELLN